MRKGAYTFGYTLPVIVAYSFNFNGWYTFTPIIIYFGLVPLIELLLKPDNRNMGFKNSQRYFSWLLYIAVPVQIAVLLYFLFLLKTNEYQLVEYFGMVSSMGLMCGVFGINIAHELGHRNTRHETLMAEILLLTSLEMHFLPYHNQGHHYNVATPNDPATARKNEPVYLFWFRSQIGSFLQAWKIEEKRLAKKEFNNQWLQNRVLLYSVIQLIFLVVLYVVFGLLPTILFVAAAAMGILLLETVNYIEHYGLLRDKKSNNKYERVRHFHSWNSDHVMGRAMLFELSRHSDHHYKASKPYQTLESLPQSPQMPTGYPGMMIFSLIPPLWFKVMNRKLNEAKVSI